MISGLTVYRFYIMLQHSTDEVSAIYGNNNDILEIQCPAGAYNSWLNLSWNASGITRALWSLS